LANPYVGMDAQLRHINVRQSFDGLILKKNYPQTNVFSGVMLNKFIAFEIGYSFSKKQYTTRKYNLALIPNVNPRRIGVRYDMLNGTPKFTAWNFSLISFVPISDNVKLISSAGFSRSKIEVKNIFSNGSSINYKNRKSLLRFTGGAQFKLIEYVGLRTMVTWENSSSILLGTVRPKNGIQYSVGLSLTLP
jgi:hypothetical protein